MLEGQKIYILYSIPACKDIIANDHEGEHGDYSYLTNLIGLKERTYLETLATLSLFTPRP